MNMGDRQLPHKSRISVQSFIHNSSTGTFYILYTAQCNILLSRDNYIFFIFQFQIKTGLTYKASSTFTTRPETLFKEINLSIAYIKTLNA